MKSLLIKTILIVSMVAVTSALAWGSDPCKDPKNWDPGKVCDPKDPSFAKKSGTEAGSPEADYPGASRTCPLCKNANQKSLNASTTAPQNTAPAKSTHPDGQQ